MSFEINTLAKATGIDAKELAYLYNKIATGLQKNAEQVSDPQVPNEYDVPEQKVVSIEKQIVNKIRSDNLRDIAIATARGQHHEPWDEKQQGRNWIDNEFYGFAILWNIANPKNPVDVEYIPRYATTVPKAETVLAALPEPVLLAFYQYVFSSAPQNLQWKIRNDMGGLKQQIAARQYLGLPL